MKLATLFCVFFLALTASARNETSGHKLLRDLKSLAVKCLVHPYTVDSKGEKIYSNLQNLCPQIHVINSQKAYVAVDGQTVLVTLVDADDSDGGDLNHLLVYNSQGQLIAQKLNVLAFNHILMGLIDGQTELVEREATP